MIQDIPIRWNSKYDMIESILSNKDALLSLSFEQVNNKIRHNIPDGAEWDILNEFCDLLAERYKFKKKYFEFSISNPVKSNYKCDNRNATY